MEEAAYIWMSLIFSEIRGMPIAKSEEDKKVVVGTIIFKEHENYLRLY